MAVALAVLDAQVRVTGPQGDRTIPLADYHRLPGDQPWRDNKLGAAELVTAVDLPPGDFSRHYTYLKLRDRLSYAFALVSVAVVLARDEAGRCTDVRIALGGVAHKPWRVPDAEALLRGGAPERALFEQVAERMLEGAVGLGDNDFKIALAHRAIVRALEQALIRRPQSQTDKRIA
jgi:xanthine dehydrogenase YagS FAD-binding subunit